MKKNLLILILFICYLTFAQSNSNCKTKSDSCKNYNIIKKGGQILLEDIKDHFHFHIFRWEKSDWMKFGIGSSAAICSYFFFDQKIYDNVEGNKTLLFKHTFYVAEKFGDLKYPLSGLFFVYFVSLITDNEKSRRVALLATEASIIAGLLTVPPKYLAGRYRPDSGKDADDWAGPHLFKNSKTSYFSGHSATAFAIAAVYANCYDETWVKVTVYSLATMTAISRVYNNRHWTSDVIVGSMVGYFVGKYISQHSTYTNITIVPNYNGNQYGASLAIKF